ncbi:hypothetical protein [Malikia spinosa]|uniref:hypothetical protein n=1 Tax=Malikia spinosa TaxID=86180 RepID=UPI001F3BFC76|nr:hypothetical protein [Malikia spinosa]
MFFSTLKSLDGLLELRHAPLPCTLHDDLGGAPVTPMVALYFDPQTVVSLDSNGQPLSYYGDRRWDLRSMSTDGESACHLYFFEAQPLLIPPEKSRPDLADLIREQQKSLLWLHMDTGNQKAQSTILRATNVLTQLAEKAYRRGVTLFELFCDPLMLGEVSAELSNTYSLNARSLLKTLWRHRNFLKIGVEACLKELIDIIRESAPKNDAEGHQTPIIPSRIYCAILAGLLGSLDDIERDLDTLLNAYRKERTVTITAPEGLTQDQLKYRRNNALEEIRESMRALGWKTGSVREFIAGEIGLIQLKLMNLVIAFSGMRIGEAQVLPLKGVLEEVEHRGSVHHVINGFSHKLKKGKKKPVSWVTSLEGFRAIILARRIASTILEVLSNGTPAADKAAVLFCSTENPYKKYDAARINARLRQELIPEICPVITQADIDELNALELERGWLREGIEVGKHWPLAFHQYRRSLSVYAHRSGMVSLPALKGQLQHITDEMRAYYSDGFCRAVNLVFDKDHFSHEWTAAKAESSFLSYQLGILFSDEDLLGRGAQRMANTVASHTRAETLKLFEQGKIAYKETVLGGCVATEDCKTLPLEPIGLECLEKNCVNQVVSPKRLEYVIRSQEGVVARLEKVERGSVEYRLEVTNLQVLLKARQRLTENA